MAWKIRIFGGDAAGRQAQGGKSRVEPFRWPDLLSSRDPWGNSRTAKLRTCHAGGRGFTDGTDSDWGYSLDFQRGGKIFSIASEENPEQGACGCR